MFFFPFWLVARADAVLMVAFFRSSRSENLRWCFDAPASLDNNLGWLSGGAAMSMISGDGCHHCDALKEHCLDVVVVEAIHVLGLATAMLLVLVMPWQWQRLHWYWL